MNNAETLFREALERLLTHTPINVSKGTKVSRNNVAKEAGKHPAALRKDRFPTLVLQIENRIKSQKVSVK